MDEGLSPNIVAEGGRAYDYPEEDINANDFKMASDHSNHVCAGCNCYRPITTIPDQIDTQDFKKPRPHLAIRNPNYLCGDGTNTSIIDNRLEDPFGNEGVLFNKGESLSAPANAGSLGSNSKNRSILKIRRRLSFNFKRSQRIGSIAVSDIDLTGIYADKVVLFLFGLRRAAIKSHGYGVC